MTPTQPFPRWFKAGNSVFQINSPTKGYRVRFKDKPTRPFFNWTLEAMSRIGAVEIDKPADAMLAARKGEK